MYLNRYLILEKLFKVLKLLGSEEQEFAKAKSCKEIYNIRKVCANMFE